MDTDESFEDIFTDSYWQANAACWSELTDMLHAELGDGSGLV